MRFDIFGSFGSHFHMDPSSCQLFKDRVLKLLKQTFHSSSLQCSTPLTLTATASSGWRSSAMTASTGDASRQSSSSSASTGKPISQLSSLSATKERQKELYQVPPLQHLFKLPDSHGSAHPLPTIDLQYTFRNNLIDIFKKNSCQF